MSDLVYLKVKRDIFSTIFSRESVVKIIESIGVMSIDIEVDLFVTNHISMSVGRTFNGFKWDRYDYFRLRLNEIKRLKVTERVLNELSI